MGASGLRSSCESIGQELVLAAVGLLQRDARLDVLQRERRHRAELPQQRLVLGR